MRVSFLRGHSHCISTPVRVGVPAKVCLGGRLARRNCKRSLFDPTLFCSCALGMSPGGRWCLLSAPGSKPAQCCFRGRFLVLAVSAAGCAPLFLCVAQRKGRRGENKKIKSWRSQKSFCRYAPRHVCVQGLREKTSPLLLARSKCWQKKIQAPRAAGITRLCSDGRGSRGYSSGVALEIAWSERYRVLVVLAM